ncbi:MAG: murein biosynthesis integral membrane protein MurJ [Candidatus Shapirobacteria bacterium]
MIKRIFTQKQNSILSAALIIMAMIALSRILGLVRNRVLAHYFEVDVLAAYFAAFRLPEVVFEVLVFGALSSAFIPTFTGYLSEKKDQEAWYVTGISLNFALLFFGVLALVIFGLSRPVYQLIAPGFSASQLELVANLSRVLLLAQAFFVVSYFLTGVLESLQRFLVPAIAPIFYNLGIILGAVFLNPYLGIYAPTVGAVIGAFLHFAVQLPLAWHFGFRPQWRLDWRHRGVREIARLAWPRMIELSFLQVGKIVELFLSSLVSTVAYTYYTFGNALQLLPVSLFGASLAKASLPVLSYHAAAKDKQKFAAVFKSSFREILFLVLPVSIFLAVMRIPLTRIVFGTARFAWESTVQTGYVVSAFSLGIFAQALIYLLARAFYALHETRIPVKASILGIFLASGLGTIFVVFGHLPVWSLALAYSLAAVVQMGVLLFCLVRRVEGLFWRELIYPAMKILAAAGLAGGVDYGLIRFWDRVIFDTRYTAILILFSFLLLLVGTGVFVTAAWLLKIEELQMFRHFWLRLRGGLFWKKSEFQQNEVVGGEGEMF